MKYNQLPVQATQTALVYGPPKTGKTELLGEVTKEFDLLYVGIENGHQTLFKLPPEQLAKVEFVLIPDTRSYPVGIETCLKIIKGNECYVDNETGKVQTAAIAKLKPELYTRVCLNELPATTIVGFDSLTQLTNSAIAHITKGKPDDYKMDYTDWGNLGKLMDAFLSHVQAAKFNIVCISHETEAEMEDGKIKIVPTAGTRAFSRNTAKYFGHVVYAEVKNKKHVFSSSTTASMNIVMGSRTDVATESMGEPSLIPIFKSNKVANQSNGQVAAQKISQLVTSQGVKKP